MMFYNIYTSREFGFRLVGLGMWLILCSAINAQEVENGEASEKNVDEQRKKEMYEKLPTIKLRGEVLDEAENKLANVQILFGWHSGGGLINKDAGGKKIATVFSDVNGKFEIELAKAVFVYFKEAKLDGYEINQSNSNSIRSKNFAVQKNALETIKIVMRKKFETSFLIKTDAYMFYIVNCRENIFKFNVDLLNNDISLGYRHKIDYADIKGEVVFNSNGELDRVVCNSSDDDNCGMILSDKKYFQAPTEGYAKQIVIEKGDFNKSIKYIYIRTRKIGIYARMELELTQFGGIRASKLGSATIKYVVYINPYGERNLEYETRIEKGGIQRLRIEQDAKIAIKENKIPEKIDKEKILIDIEQRQGKSGK